MYNVFQAYDETYKKYGKEVYVSALFSSNPSGAPSTTVKSLADVYCDSLVAIYNLRIATKIRGSSEIGIAIYYLVMAVILLLVIASGLLYAVYKQYKHVFEPDVSPEKSSDLYKMIIFFLAIISALVFLVLIACVSYSRTSQITQKISNINFASSESLFSQQITSIFPFLLTSIKTKKYLKYVTMPAEQKMYESLVTFSKMFKKVKTKIDKNIVITYEPLDVQNKGLQAVLIYQLLQRGVEFSFIPNYNGVKFPGFSDTFRPSRLLRDIQKVDLIGQVNRLGDSVSYFKTFLRKSAGGGNQDANSSKDKIIQGLISLFSKSENNFMITDTFVPTRAMTSVINKDAGNALACGMACDNNQQCALSVFNTNGTCAIIDKETAKKYPLFYVPNGTDGSFQTYMKSGNKVFIASPEVTSKIKNLPLEMKYIDNKQKKSLDVNQACLYDAETGKCLGDNYSSIDGSVNINSIFANNKYEDSLNAYTQGNNQFTLKTTTDAIIDSLVTKNPNIDASVDFYVDKAVKLCKQYDPSLSVQFSPADIQQIGDSVVRDWTSSGIDVRDLITTVMDKIPAILDQQRLDQSIETTTDRRDGIYLDGQELLAKISSMSDFEFVSEFLTNLYNISSCSDGLNKIQSFYDFTVQDIQKGKLLLNLFATLVIIQGLCFMTYSLISSYPKYSSELEEVDTKIQEIELDKQVKILQKSVEDMGKAYSSKLGGGDSEKLSDKARLKQLHTKEYNIRLQYYIKYLLIAGVIILTIVLLQVSAQRRERIGLYNYDIMRKNGDTLKQTSNSLLDQMLLDIYEGRVMALPQNNDVFGAIKASDERMYIIDAFKDNMKLFDKKTKVTLKNINGKYLRDKLVDLIEAHEKCNSLLFGANIEMPFPIYETSIYVFLVLVIVICLAIIAIQLKPVDNFKRIKYWKRIQENGKRMKHIVPSEYQFTSEDPDNLGNDTKILVQVFLVLLIPFAVALFSSQLLKSTSSLSTALYGSNLYRTSTCYDL
jgi:hypothetical protein